MAGKGRGWWAVGSREGQARGTARLFQVQLCSFFIIFTFIFFLIIC